MKRTDRLSKTAVLALVLFGICFSQHSFAQSARIDGGNLSYDMFGFYWETRLEPGTPPMSESFVTQTINKGGVVHRVLLDRSGRVYAGYDVLVRLLPEPNTYNVSFRRMQMTPEIASRVMGDDAAKWTEFPTDGWMSATSFITIHGGDVIGLRLFQNPATGQAVVDYITIQEPARKFQGFNGTTPERKFEFAPGPTRDFKADDVELTIRSPRLSVNGKLDETSNRRFDEVQGAMVWIFVAKHGRYLLSLTPHPELGFKRAGEVRGSSLTFDIGGEKFKLDTGGRIAPGQSAFNLYVLHEPNWKPTYRDADISVFNMGVADNTELRK